MLKGKRKRLRLSPSALCRTSLVYFFNVLLLFYAMNYSNQRGKARRKKKEISLFFFLVHLRLSMMCVHAFTSKFWPKCRYFLLSLETEYILKNAFQLENFTVHISTSWWINGLVASKKTYKLFLLNFVMTCILLDLASFLIFVFSTFYRNWCKSFFYLLRVPWACNYWFFLLQMMSSSSSNTQAVPFRDMAMYEPFQQSTGWDNTFNTITSNNHNNNNQTSSAVARREADDNNKVRFFPDSCLRLVIIIFCLISC